MLSSTILTAMPMPAAIKPCLTERINLIRQSE